jgi:hypothetical protein
MRVPFIKKGTPYRGRKMAVILVGFKPVKAIEYQAVS